MTTPIDYNFETASSYRVLQFPLSQLCKNDFAELGLAAIASPKIVRRIGGRFHIFLSDNYGAVIPSELSNKLSLGIFHLIHSAHAAGFRKIEFLKDVPLPEELGAPPPEPIQWGKFKNVMGSKWGVVARDGVEPSFFCQSEETADLLLVALGFQPPDPSLPMLKRLQEWNEHYSTKEIKTEDEEAPVDSSPQE